MPESTRQLKLHKLALRGLWWIKWIVCDRVIEKFKIQNLKAVQRESLKKVILPTRLGKSLIFQAAPMVFDVVKRQNFQSMAVVISPLMSLTKDQVDFFKSTGVTAEKSKPINQ